MIKTIVAVVTAAMAATDGGQVPGISIRLRWDADVHGPQRALHRVRRRLREGTMMTYQFPCTDCGCTHHNQEAEAAAMRPVRQGQGARLRALVTTGRSGTSCSSTSATSTAKTRAHPRPASGAPRREGAG